MIQSGTAGKPTPLEAMRRHFIVCTLIVLLCVGAAVYAARQQPQKYTGEARVGVTGNGLSSDALGAFPLASQELAADYARYVNNAEEQSSLEEQLGVKDGDVQEVTASPIPDSNVVRIEVVAADQGTAVRAAQTIAERLTSGVNDTSTRDADIAAALQQYTALSTQVADAQQAAAAAQLALDQALGRASTGFPRNGDDITALRAAAAATAAQVAILDVQRTAQGERYQSLITNVGTAANLRVVMPAESKGSDRVVQMQRFGLVGLAAGLLLAMGAAILLERRRRRVRSVTKSAPKSADAAAEATPPAGATTATTATTATSEPTEPTDPTEPTEPTDPQAANGSTASQGRPADRTLAQSGAGARADDH